MQTAYIGTIFNDFSIKNESETPIIARAVLYNKPNGCSVNDKGGAREIAPGESYTPVFDMTGAKVGRYNLEVYKDNDPDGVRLVCLVKDAVEAVTVSKSAI